MRVEPFDTQRHMVFSRRAALFSGATILLFAGLGGRLYQLQVRDHENYRALAEDNRFNQRVIVPLRGEIYDRFGVPLASNRQNFRVLLIAEETTSVEQSLRELEKIIQISDRQKQKVLRDVRRKRAFTPIEVASNLSWEDFARINFKTPDLPGLHSEAAETRSYPFGEATASVVGYVGAPSERDIERADSDATRLLLRQPGFRLGRAGLERTQDDALRGEAGSKMVQVNAHGRVIEEYPNKEDEPVQGEPLGLTIDTELQLAAMEVLARPITHGLTKEDLPEPVSASAVVMDVVTGDLLVMASVPSFDPNDFNVGIKAALWKELNDSPYKPLLNKTVNGLYPPGSTFKLLTAIAAQEAGIKPNYRVRCRGSIYYGGNEFSCWKQGGHGMLDMKGSIKHSCDVYFWTLAQQLDVDAIANVAKRFGLGRTYDLGMGSEQAGVVPSREWKRKRFRSTPAQQKWFPGETLSVAIGQGAVTSTPLQQAVMAARIATGKMIEPRIVRMKGQKILQAPQFAEVSVDIQHLDLVRRGMDAVTNEWGTAARSRLENPEWRLAGKTGTSQVMSLQRDPVTGQRIRNEDLPWRQRDHALFVCFAPFDNPRYACSVVVEHGMSGSRSAGPKARDIMREVLRKDPANKKSYDPATDKPVKIADLAVLQDSFSKAGGRP